MSNLNMIPSNHIPVSGCLGAFHGRPPLDAACPHPGWAVDDLLSHQRPRPAVWTSRSSGGSAQHSPESVWSAAPLGLWSPVSFKNAVALVHCSVNGNLSTDCGYVVNNTSMVQTAKLRDAYSCFGYNQQFVWLGELMLCKRETLLSY